MKKQRVSHVLLVVTLTLLIVLPSTSRVVAQTPGTESGLVATMKLATDNVSWQPLVGGTGYVLTISGPEEFYMQHTYQPGEPLVFWAKDEAGMPRSSGSYQYELYILPTDVPEKVPDAQRGFVSVASTPVQSGHFMILDAAIVVPDFEEVTEGVPPGDGGDNGIMDQVMYDDLIVVGSTCVGQDCSNGESFGFDTLRLKENNLRIHFQDTSTSASFPTRDWRISINDSANGGADYFAIQDVDDGRNVFVIEGSAGSNALYIDDYGRVGLGTSTPAVELENRDGDTPTFRMNQDGSSGWAAQTWDLAGNEANFFIRDVTNGSQLPFRIQPGADSNALTIKSNGNIGIGTWDPGFPLEIERTGANPQVLLERTDGATAIFGAISDKTRFGSRTAHPVMLVVSNVAHSTFETDGDLTLVNGNVNALAFNPSSDVSLKENFTEVDGQEVLAQLAEIPITSWNFKKDEGTVRHMGPVAQDFYAAYGLGEDNLHISTVDADGVALASIQGLYEIVQEQEEQITALEAQNTELETRLTNLEQTVGVHSTVGLSFFVVLPWFLSGMLFLAIIGMLVFKRYANIKKQS